MCVLLLTHQTCNGSRSQRVRLKISGSVKVGASILVMMGGYTIGSPFFSTTLGIESGLTIRLFVPLISLSSAVFSDVRFG